MATEAGTQTLATEAAEERLPRAVDHWETHKQTSEAGLEMANRNLARLALQTSGQLELELTANEEALL